MDVDLTATPDAAYALASVGDGKYVIGFRKFRRVQQASFYCHIYDTDESCYT